MIDPFVMEIRKEVKDCQFGALKADLMLHVLIRGIDDERMRCRLFEVENLDLAKAIRMCQTMEATAADLQHLVSKKTEMVEGETAGVALLSKKRYTAQKTQKKWQQWRNKVGKSQEENRIGKGPIGDPEPNQPGKQWSNQAGCSRCGYDHKPRQCPVYREKNCQMSSTWPFCESM